MPSVSDVTSNVLSLPLIWKFQYSKVFLPHKKETSASTKYVGTVRTSPLPSFLVIKIGRSIFEVLTYLLEGQKTNGWLQGVDDI